MASKLKKIKLTEFQIHQQSCKKCLLVDFSETKTLINCCLDGAPLLKDHVNFYAKKDHLKINKALKVQFEDTTRTTKKKLKEVMKYSDQTLI